MVEPHEMSQNRRAALVLMAWVREGPVAGHWVVFRYAHLRGFEALGATFARREIPSLLMDWRGPQKEPGLVRAAGLAR